MSFDPRALAQRLEVYDVSTLVTLRALLRSGDPYDWRSLDRLAAEVANEYDRLAADPNAPVHSLSAPWEGSGDRDDLPLYLDAHVVRRLEADGVIERSVEAGDAGDGAALTRAVRLTARDEPGPGVTSGGLIEMIDARLAAHSLATHEGPSGSSAAGAALERGDGPADGLTLSSEGLVKVYRKRRVVNDVALHVSQGEIVGLLGPNGAGKTTTFYMIVGLIPPDAGRVYLGDDEVTTVPMYRRARMGVGYLAQEPSVFRKLTVEENVLAILQMLGLPKRVQKERLELLLDELGIKHLRRSKAYSLSGGERRRLEITRALVGDPKFMLLDEPFAGVDPIAVHDIQQIVADLRRRHIGVLISDHNVEQTLDIVDRAYIMYDGRVRVSGTVSELVWNDEVAEIYLGPTLTARMRERYPEPESFPIS